MRVLLGLQALALEAGGEGRVCQAAREQQEPAGLGEAGQRREQGVREEVCDLSFLSCLPHDGFQLCRSPQLMFVCVVPVSSCSLWLNGRCLSL